MGECKVNCPGWGTSRHSYFFACRQWEVTGNSPTSVKLR